MAIEKEIAINKLKMNNNIQFIDKAAKVFNEKNTKEMKKLQLKRNKN